MIYLFIKIALFLALFFIFVMLIDGNRFKLIEYTVSSKKIQEDVKLVVLADLHNKTYGMNNEKLLSAIKKVNPDAVIVAGDMIISQANKPMDKTIRFLQELGKKYVIYYGLGNHEHKIKNDIEEYGTMYQRYERALNMPSIRILDNKRVYRKDWNIDICGLDIEKDYYKKLKKKKMQEKYVFSKVGAENERAFQVLIAHNPEYFEQYASWGADLVLSGHIHGGIMKLPLLGGVISPSFRLFPKYDGGLFKHNNTLMILSRGLGMHTIPIRIFNPGELVVLHLKKQED